MDPITREVLALDHLLELLAERAASTLGAEWIRARTPATEENAVRRQLALTGEVLALRDEDRLLPMGGVTDVSPALHRAAVQGSALDAEEWRTLSHHLRAVGAVARFGEAARPFAPLVAEECARLHPNPELLRAIERTFDDDGTIRDSASPRLAQARADLRRAEAAVQSTIQRLLSDLGGGDVLQDAYATLRNGRHVLPVRANMRGRLQGIVHGSSNTGETVYVEPAPVVEASNDAELARERERAEIARILRELTDQLRPTAKDALGDLEVLALLDGTNAFARAAAERNWHLAVLEDGPVRLLSAHHPILHLTRPQSSVPITMDLSGEDRTVVLSGPNAGGKTTAMKMLALNAALLQIGAPIPASADSRLPLFRGFHADIGDQQSLDEGISTFSGHMRRIRQILEEADGDSLVLLDELGTGTDPQEGGALGVAILEELLGRARLTVVTSHLQPVKQWAEETPHVRNASFTLDPATHRPTFRLRLDLPGASEALAMAQNEGLPRGVLTRARSLVGEQHLRLSELLERVQARERELVERERELRETKERLQAQLDLSIARAEDLREERRRVRQMALMERQAAAREAREKVERLIASLPSMEALEQRKRALTDARKELASDQSSIFAKLAAMQREDVSKAGSLRQGMRVYVLPLGAWGKVEEVLQGGTKARVSVGVVTATLSSEDLLDREPPLAGRSAGKQALRTRASVDEPEQDEAEESPGGGKKKRSKKLKDALEVAATLEPTPAVSPAPGQTRAQHRARVAKQAQASAPPRSVGNVVLPKEFVPMELDLHGKRVEEAMVQLDKYLDRALLMGYPYVRIIHGTGEGKLYRAVHEFLRTWPGDAKWRAGTPDEGGGGVTVVEL